MKKPLIYLCSPHSHLQAEVRQSRYEEALKCTSWLVSNGFWVYSPIVSNHNLPCNIEKNISWEYWKEFDTEMITRCDELWVLDIEGTSSSVGVKAEIEIAGLLGKRIIIIKPFYPDPDYQVIEWSPAAIHLGIKLSTKEESSKEDAQTT